MKGSAAELLEALILGIGPMPGEDYQQVMRGVKLLRFWEEHETEWLREGKEAKRLARKDRAEKRKRRHEVDEDDVGPPLQKQTDALDGGRVGGQKQKHTHALEQEGKDGGKVGRKGAGKQMGDFSLRSRVRSRSRWMPRAKGSIARFVPKAKGSILQVPMRRSISMPPARNITS